LREGYESLVLRPQRDSDRFESGRFFGLDAPGIGKAVAALEPNAVLVAGWHSLALARAIAACLRRRIPLLYRGDTHALGRERNLFWSLRSRWLLGLFDRFLAVGTRVREHLARLGVPDRFVFWSPHAVDNEFFARRAEPLLEPENRAEARRQWGIAPDEFVALFVGKLTRNKRPTDLLRAFRLIKGRRRILVVGAGPLQAECAALASELGVVADFRGFMNQKALPLAYAISDCLVLPSERESWGLTVNEAMACGLPAIVSDGVGCAADLVKPGKTGEVFPVGATEILAQRLEGIAQDVRSGIRRSSQCRAEIARYSFAAATEGLVSACRSLAN
jgi:glycosyltransferase involved in cell wall biosynthesis